MRNYLCSHDDERVWPIQRDQHNRVCDVYKDQHKLAYLTHFMRSAHIMSYFFKYFGFDEVNVSRGIRIIMHSQFD